MSTPNLFSVQAPGFAATAGTSASASAPLPVGGPNIRLVSKQGNTAMIYVAIGTGTQTATIPGATAASTCCAVGVNADLSFSMPYVPGQQLNYSVISDSAAQTIVIYTSDGN